MEVVASPPRKYLKAAELKESEFRIKRDLLSRLTELSACTDPQLQWKLIRRDVIAVLRSDLWDEGNPLNGSEGVVSDRRRRLARVWILRRIYAMYRTLLANEENCSNNERLGWKEFFLLRSGDVARYIGLEDPRLKSSLRWQRTAVALYRQVIPLDAVRAARSLSVAFQGLQRYGTSFLYSLATSLAPSALHGLLKTRSNPTLSLPSLVKEVESEIRGVTISLISELEDRSSIRLGCETSDRIDDGRAESTGGLEFLVQQLSPWASVGLSLASQLGLRYSSDAAIRGYCELIALITANVVDSSDTQPPDVVSKTVLDDLHAILHAP